MARSSSNGTDHEFGGPWTELKLDAVEYYLKFYTTALKAQPFDLWYVDAFAGSGQRATREMSGGLYDGKPLEMEIVQRAGSARRALAIEPPFHRFVFIEKDRRRFTALSELGDLHPERSIECMAGDANEILPDLFGKPPWHPKPRWGARANRAVVFLDPYGLSLEWRTLEALAKTQAIDLWYLFPTAGVIQQLANNFRGVDSHKQRALDRIFGSPLWREKFYRPSQQASLIGTDPDIVRIADRADIEGFFEERLRTLFRYVSPPLPLLTERGSHLFSLYFSVANPSPKARLNAESCVRSLLKKHGPGASRHMFDH